MVSRKLMTSNPKAVAGLIRAINKGMIRSPRTRMPGSRRR